MTSLRPDTSHQDPSLPLYWRRRPEVLRKHVADHRLLESPGIFDAWCHDATSIRVYMLAEARSPGAARAMKVDWAEDAFRLRDEASQAGVPVTVLLNGIGRHSPEVCALRESLGVPLSWREDDIVATYSLEGSGIGFHIGHEDGFIVQLAGSRLWRIWTPEVVASEFHLQVLGDPRFTERSAPQRCGTAPVLEVELAPGDALHVPALFPHEGVTIEAPSVGLSVGWRGVNRWRLLTPAQQALVSHDHLTNKGDAWWFGLLPDLDHDAHLRLVESVAEQLADELVGA